MREIRTSGSEGGGDLTVSPYPYHISNMSSRTGRSPARASTRESEVVA